MNLSQLIDDYVAGPTLLRDAVAGMMDEELNAAPIAGRIDRLPL